MIFDREHRTFSAVFVLFGFFTALFWSVFFDNHLVEREQTQLFLWGTSYLKQHFLYQGGFSVYWGEFLTQFFRAPWFGAILIAALLLSLALSIRNVLRYFSQNPLLDVLSFFPAIAYGFVFYNSFYPVAGVVALIIALQMVSFFLRFDNRTMSLYWGVALLPVVYWLAGGAYLLYGCVWILALLIRPAGKTSVRHPSLLVRLFGLLGLALLMVAVPLIFRQMFLFDTAMQSYLSEAFYKLRFVFPMPVLWISIGIVVAILVARLFASAIIPRKSGFYEVTMLVLLTAFMAVGVIGNANFSVERELRFSNWVHQQKWVKIIESEPDWNELGPQGRVALALALAHEGQLTSRAFELHIKKEDLFLKYDLKGVAPFLVSDVFYALGMNNFAQMMALESIESAPDGKWPARAMKRAAQTYVVNGQYAVAEKYLLKLEKTLFYRKWASETLELIQNETALLSHPDWAKQRASAPKADFLYNDAALHIALVHLLQANIDNRAAYEYLMAHFLFTLDFDAFLAHLEFYNHYHYSETPKAVQEAIAYVETIAEELPAYVKAIPVEDEVRQDLKRYANRYMQGGTKNQQTLKTDFGDTFWYYLHFEANE